MNPYIIEIGNFGIKWYSVLMLSAILIATLFILKEAKKFKIDKDFLFNMIFWAVVFGIIGARVYYILFNLDYYSEHIVEIFKIWEGGLAIHGALIAGILTIIIYCKKYKVSSLKIFDIMAPYMLLAQAIGRWGNFFNSEAYGTMTTLGELESLKIIPRFVIDGMYINGAYYTPTFLYESLWCLIGFIILLIVRKFKYIRIGQTTGLYFMFYSLGRFFIESFRLDSLMLGNFKMAQIISIVIFVIGLIIFLVQFRRSRLEGLYNEKEKIEVVNF